MEGHCDSTYWNKSNLNIIYSIIIVIAVIITIYGSVKEGLFCNVLDANEQQFSALVWPFWTLSMTIKKTSIF